MEQPKNTGKEDVPTTPPWERVDIEVRGPGGILARARNLRKLDYAIIVVLIIFGYMFYQHMQDTKTAIIEQVKSNTEVASSIRLFACLYAVGSERREIEAKDQYSLCNRIGKSQ